MMNEPGDTHLSEKRSIVKRHTHGREARPPKALVYNPEEPERVTEEDINESKDETVKYFRNRCYMCVG